MDSIREVQAHISSALSDWAGIMLDIEDHNKSFLLHYKEKDLLNAVFILSHVLSNIGIHNGTIDEDEAVFVGSELRKFVKRYSSIDTVESTNKK